MENYEILNELCMFDPMRKYIHQLGLPLFCFCGILMVYALFSLVQRKGHSQVIRSDGSGYYAYLPALLLYDDPSFQQSSEAEIKYAPNKGNPLYLYPTKEGKVYNKYYPGAAVLQAPAFLLATLYSWLAGLPMDGYSPVYGFFFHLSSLCYAFLGLFLFHRVLVELFPERRKWISWFVPLSYLATPLFFYAFETPSFTHHLSFFLFAFVAHLLVRKQSVRTLKAFFLLGLCLGLIFLVRPTNLLVVLAIPVVLGSREKFLVFWNALWHNRAKSFTAGLLGFVLPCLVLPLLWKWQTGHWWVWSYSGEGFNWFSPQIVETLIGFRVGLIWQTPLFALVLIAWVFSFKQNSWFAWSYLLYFSILTWVVSAWWCWDYESVFGHRAYTEHFLFLLLPLLTWRPKRGRVLVFIALASAAIVSLIRFGAIKSGWVGHQRFTAANYLPTLAFWDATLPNRFAFTEACQPFGQCIETVELVHFAEVRTIHTTDEYSLTATHKLGRKKLNQRVFLTLELEKYSNDPMDEVYLVIDAVGDLPEERFYKAISIFNDQLSEKGTWSTFKSQNTLYDNFSRLHTYTAYLWNPKKRTLQLKNVRIDLKLFEE